MMNLISENTAFLTIHYTGGQAQMQRRLQLPAERAILSGQYARGACRGGECAGVIVILSDAKNLAGFFASLRMTECFPGVLPALN